MVDRVGRLQLPQEYMEKLRLRGLASVDIDGDQVSIKSAADSPRPLRQARREAYSGDEQGQREDE